MRGNLVEECIKYENGYAMLTEIISPYLGDFEGINTKGEFDLICAYREVLANLSDNVRRKEQECKELRKRLENAKFNFEQKSKVLKETGVVQDAENGGYKIPQLDRCLKALEEIENLIDNDDFGYCPLDDTEDCHYTTYKNILDIISRAKGEGNNAG